MKHSPIVFAALPLLAACSAAQVAQGLRDMNQIAAAISAPPGEGATTSAASGSSAAPSLRHRGQVLDEAVAKQNGFKIGDAVTGVLSDDGQVDEFRFEGNKGDAFTFYVQALPGRDGKPHLTWFQIYNTTGQVLLHELPSDGSQPIEDNHSGRIELQENGTYRVRIKPNYDNHLSTYRFYTVPIVEAPEARAESFQIGQIVQGEAIDSPNDVDTFYFEAIKGQRVVLHSLSELTTQPLLWLTLHNTTGRSEIATIPSDGSKPLQDNHTDVITLPETGRYKVNVRGNYPQSVGNYRFVIRPVQ